MPEAIPEDLKEIVQKIAKDAEDMELRLSEFKFVHSVKMFGVAVGGAVFVLGILFVLIAFFLALDVFGLNIPGKIIVATASTSAVIGIIQMTAGILLIGK